MSEESHLRACIVELTTSASNYIFAEHNLKTAISRFGDGGEFAKMADATRQLLLSAINNAEQALKP